MLNIKAGNQVKITDFYLSNYSPSWIDQIKDKPATVVSITQRSTITAEKLKENKDLPLYLNFYGLHKVYPVIEMRIKFDGDDAIYIVSPLGFK